MGELELKRLVICHAKTSFTSTKGKANASVAVDTEFVFARSIAVSAEAFIDLRNCTKTGGRFIRMRILSANGARDVLIAQAKAVPVHAKTDLCGSCALIGENL